MSTLKHKYSRLLLVLFVFTMLVGCLSCNKLEDQTAGSSSSFSSQSNYSIIDTDYMPEV